MSNLFHIAWFHHQHAVVKGTVHLKKNRFGHLLRADMLFQTCMIFFIFLFLQWNTKGDVKLNIRH